MGELKFPDETGEDAYHGGQTDHPECDRKDTLPTGQRRGDRDDDSESEFSHKDEMTNGRWMTSVSCARRECGIEEYAATWSDWELETSIKRWIATEQLVDGVRRGGWI